MRGLYSSGLSEIIAGRPPCRARREGSPAPAPPSPHRVDPLNEWPWGRPRRPVPSTILPKGAAMPPSDIALIGLGVMGQNLALNMARHGYRVAAFNPTGRVPQGVLHEGPGGGAT